MRLRGHRGTHAEPDKVSDPHADRGPDGRADRRADGAGEDALADSPSYYASDGTSRGKTATLRRARPATTYPMWVLSLFPTH